MSRSLLEDAIAHHVWATLRLVDACLALRLEHLETAVPGTYGSILDTMRHLVASDRFDLFVVTGERTPLIDEGQMGLAELRTVMEENSAEWSRLLRVGIDPDFVLHEVDPDDGYQRDAPMGIWLAQVLHHGTDHRSQVSTALTSLGLEPPAISAWDFGIETGRVAEVYPAP